VVNITGILIPDSCLYPKKGWSTSSEKSGQHHKNRWSRWIGIYNKDRPNEIFFSDSLYSGHGTVWLPDKESLFALGYNQLRDYKLKDWETAQPSLEMVNEWKIPDESGHDLFLTSDQRLLLSTTNSVWQFDIAVSEFKPLKGVEHVKSVNLNVEKGELVYTK